MKWKALPDALPDEVNFLEQGKHYGFPWRFGNTDNPVREPAYSPEGWLV
jgi:glucose/arabinose dehydrogenase